MTLPSPFSFVPHSTPVQDLQKLIQHYNARWPSNRVNNSFSFKNTPSILALHPLPLGEELAALNRVLRDAELVCGALRAVVETHPIVVPAPPLLGINSTTDLPRMLVHSLENRLSTLNLPPYADTTIPRGPHSRTLCISEQYRDIRQCIALVTMFLRQLDQERARRLRQLNARAPVNQLPTEILCEIFDACKNVSEHAHTSNAALVATCAHWRMIATNQPSLWNTIVYDFRITPIARVLTFIRRSRASRLNIHLVANEHTSLAEVDFIMATLYPHLYRCREFSLRAMFYDTARQIFPIHISMPSLVSLRVIVTWEQSPLYRLTMFNDSLTSPVNIYVAGRDTQPLPFTLGRFNASRLREISVRGQIDHSEMMLLVSQASMLSKLVWHDQDGYRGGRYPLNIVAQSMLHLELSGTHAPPCFPCPSIQHLAISHQYGVEGFLASCISFDFLKNLYGLWIGTPYLHPEIVARFIHSHQNLIGVGFPAYSDMAVDVLNILAQPLASIEWARGADSLPKEFPHLRGLCLASVGGDSPHPLGWQLSPLLRALRSYLESDPVTKKTAVVMTYGVFETQKVPQEVAWVLEDHANVSLRKTRKMDPKLENDDDWTPEELAMMPDDLD